MIIHAIFFYLFASVTVASAVMVISARNPVHSVLFLILAFVNAAGLFVLLGAEFLAMILIVVYVGAVAVLFLFVVMMLDVDFAQLRQGFLNYLPVGALIGVVLLVELLLIVGGWVMSPPAAHPASPIAANVSNTEALGLVLYTRYVYFFEAAGVILLVAMIGAIVMTLQHKPQVRRQNIAAQVARRRADAIELVKVKPGQGLS
jgi:NADH-quinone oxidoreductase subunit J